MSKLSSCQYVHYLPICSSITHLVNKAQFLNATLIFSSPPVAVVSPVTKIYAFE